MPRYKVPASAYQQSLMLARTVFAGSMDAPSAERELRDSFPGMSPRAAKGYIGSYLAMRRGTKQFGTTIAAEAWRLYLDDIAKDGSNVLSLALDAFLSHITYLQSKTKGTESALYSVYEEFVNSLRVQVGHDAAVDNLDREVEQSLTTSSEERRRRLAEANRKPEQMVVYTRVYKRNPDVIAEVLLRANGVCEGCSRPAPFQRPDGRPYLEVHHRTRLADGGDDSVENAVALCPNCHRQRHYGATGIAGKETADFENL